MAKRSFKSNSRSSFTGLMRASAFGRAGSVKEMLDSGADPNYRGPRGATALMFAASGGHLEVVKELVDSGADVSVMEDGGWTAKRHAEEDGHADVAQFLEKLTAKVFRERRS